MLETLAGQHDANLISLIGQTTVPEMAAVIRSAALLIGNNSGSMHIAAALTAAHGDPFLRHRAAGAVGAAHAVKPVFSTGATACTPCHGFQCPYQMECLDISPEEIVTAADVMNLLQHRPCLDPPPVAAGQRSASSGGNAMACKSPTREVRGANESSPGMYTAIICIT